MEVNDDTIEPGMFVRELNGGVGVGRVVEIAGLNAVLEYVDLPVRRIETRTVPLEGIERAELLEETRVWVSTESNCGHGWLPGRVRGSLPDGKIAVKFPQQTESIPVSLKDVVVRCDKELTACDEAVGIGFVDSPGYYRARSQMGYRRALTRSHAGSDATVNDSG